MLTDARTDMTIRTLLTIITSFLTAVISFTFQPHCPQGKAPSIEQDSGVCPPLPKLLCAL